MGSTLQMPSDAISAAERDTVARRFLGVSADEFVRKYHAGEYATHTPPMLRAVLAFFPELD